MNLLTMQSSPFPCYALTFRPKYLPGTHTANGRLLMRVMKFHMHTKQDDKLQCCVF